MPDPTRAQFDAAAKKVMETAPAGLSREQFFALIDKELAGGPKPVADSEPGDYWGGVRKSIGESLSLPGLWDTTKRYMSAIPGGAKDAVSPHSILEGMRAWSKDDAKRKMGVFPEDEHDMIFKPNPLGTPEGVGHATGGAMVGAVIPEAIGLAKAAPYRSMASGTLKGGAAVLDNPVATFASHRLPMVGKLMEKAADKIGTTPRPTPFSGLPLAVQQDQLPATPAPETTRFAGPPATGHEDVPFNELPIYKQMEQTAQTPEATVPLVGGRTQIPPAKPSPTTIDESMARTLAEEKPLDSRVSSLPPESVTAAETKPPVDNHSDLLLKLGGRGEAPADLPLRESAPASLEDAVRQLIEEDVVPERPGALQDSTAPLDEHAAPEAFRSTENPEWHGGHEPGSVEARGDQLSHQYEGELDNSYRAATEEERAYFADKARQKRLQDQVAQDYAQHKGDAPRTPGSLESGPDLVTLIKKLFRR